MIVKTSLHNQGLSFSFQWVVMNIQKCFGNIFVTPYWTITNFMTPFQELKNKKTKKKTKKQKTKNKKQTKKQKTTTTTKTHTHTHTPTPPHTHTHITPICKARKIFIFEAISV